jgi:hypothetical protein
MKQNYTHIRNFIQLFKRWLLLLLLSLLLLLLLLF